MKTRGWQLIVAGAMWSAFIFGCTIIQTAQPVPFAETEARQICVIEDPSVFRGFLPAYKSALEEKGFSVSILRRGSPIVSCPLTSTYYALRSWDFVTYLSHAIIVVYRNGTKVGEAVYDAPKAGFALTFRIYESTDSKVGTMVDQLFPTMSGKGGGRGNWGKSGS